jgi:hypothetical protein
MGILKTVKFDGQEVESLSADILLIDLLRIQMTPVVRNRRTAELFDKCGMVQGAVATFVEVPGSVWKSFCREAGLGDNLGREFVART